MRGGSEEKAQAGSQEEEGSSESGGGEGQLTRVDDSSPVQGTSYVSPLVEIFGDIFIGENSFVAGNTILRRPTAEAGDRQRDQRSGQHYRALVG